MTGQTSIIISSPLSGIHQGHLTIDASNRGVILDGSQIPEGWNSGLEIHSSGNIIRGLQIINFSGAGIAISEGENNTIENNISCGNGYGIGLWGTSTYENVIKHNYLGVLADEETPCGNSSAGITIMEGAHNNSIGADNHIAFNQHNGIEILDKATVGNQIFENSIHDNGADGINLTHGGNKYIGAPLLMDFNLDGGSLDGIACPDCEVNIYSDIENEGSKYEGKTIADHRGMFFLEKGSAFSGPFLTATATDAQGNTSPFSIPTVGNYRSTKLQTDNTNLKTSLVIKPSGDLADNRLGSSWGDFWQPGDFQFVIDNEIVPSGLKWVKLSFNQGEYYTSDQSNVELYWDKPEFYISTEFNDYISQLTSQGITIDYLLNFWDKVNHPNGWDVPARFKTEEYINHYLEYVRFIVSHFKGSVKYYKLWNEPNIRYPLQFIEPADYINLAKRTIPLIKEIDPQAKVILASTSGTANPQAQDYLFEILNSDVMPIADAISWHPLYGNIPGSGEFPDFYSEYPSLLASIIETGKKNGFQGEYIAGEISYGGSTCGGCDVVDPSYSDTVWAKYTARGLILHFGNDVAALVGNFSSQQSIHFKTIRNIANVFAGVHSEQFPVEVQIESDNFKIFTFTGTDDNRLVALWTDGIAVDNDPGIPSILTIPDYAGWNATGIDILNSLEQELITSNENGNLVIRDLLIKDYPIIVQLSK